MPNLLSDRILEKAIKEGDFDHLRGKGKPLNLEDESMIKPEWRLVYRVLKNAGMVPFWLELDTEIRRAYQEAREDLAYAAKDLRSTDPGWKRAQERFLKQLEPINDQIRELNLKVPHSRFQRKTLDADVELKRILTYCEQAQGLDSEVELRGVEP
ncbi:MAG: DUF1992 domain-containing protein [Anaerolineales bacterium]|nr:DUF1992 domain-containing protein [Anaerolineales bacterium]